MSDLEVCFDCSEPECTLCDFCGDCGADVVELSGLLVETCGDCFDNEYEREIT